MDTTGHGILWNYYNYCTTIKFPLDHELDLFYNFYNLRVPLWELTLLICDLYTWYHASIINSTVNNNIIITTVAIRTIRYLDSRSPIHVISTKV